jgi:hypothetical protein
MSNPGAAAMLWSLNAMRNRPVLARDGRIGSVSDVYFDDALWRVRHVVVDTGHAMPQREVLIPPGAIAPDQPEDDSVHLEWRRADVEWSPEAGSDMPRYQQDGVVDLAPHGDPHLRSSAIIISYGIEALDGPLGYLDDLLAEDTDWSIASVVILTANWSGGRRVWVAPNLVQDIDRPSRKVRLRITRKDLRNARGSGAGPSRPPLHA